MSDVFELFFNTLLHNDPTFYNCLTRDTYANVRIKYTRNYIEEVVESMFQQIRGIHTEIRIINYIRKRITKEHWNIQEVSILINFSPCGHCVSKITQLLNEYPGMRWNLRFVGLYNIRRSCLVEQHQHLQITPLLEKKSENNKYGLRSLNQINNLNIGNFREEDWNKLAVVLQVILVMPILQESDENKEGIRKLKAIRLAKGKFRDDWNKLAVILQVQLPWNMRQRLDEDKVVSEDLAAILTYMH